MAGPQGGNRSEVDFRINRSGGYLNATFRGDVIGGTVEAAGTADDPPGVSSEISIAAVFLALIFVVGGLGAFALYQGRSFSFTIKLRGIEVTVSIGGEEGGPTLPVIADPSCDLMPPINC